MPRPKHYVGQLSHLFTEKIAKQNRLFWKNAKKSKKYGAKREPKIETFFSPSHPSSTAVRAGRFAPPNFFGRPPESGLMFNCAHNLHNLEFLVILGFCQAQPSPSPSSIQIQIWGWDCFNVTMIQWPTPGKVCTRSKCEFQT